MNNRICDAVYLYTLNKFKWTPFQNVLHYHINEKVFLKSNKELLIASPLYAQKHDVLRSTQPTMYQF